MKIFEMVQPMEISGEQEVIDLLKSDGPIINDVRQLYNEIKSVSTLDDIPYVKTPRTAYGDDLFHMGYIVENFIKLLLSSGYGNDSQSVKLLKESLSYLRSMS